MQITSINSSQNTATSFNAKMSKQNYYQAVKTIYKSAKNEAELIEKLQPSSGKINPKIVETYMRADREAYMLKESYERQQAQKTGLCQKVGNWVRNIF